MALRWLAGGSYLDIADMHGVHPATFFDKLWDTLYALDKVTKLSFDVKNMDAMRTAEASFFRNNHGSLKGCVGAIDGIAISGVCPYIVFLREPPNGRHACVSMCDTVVDRPSAFGSRGS
jgi:hypothetical protein